MHRQVDLAGIKGGCISGLESGEIDFLMDISNLNNPVDQLTHRLQFIPRQEME